ncbi:MAG: hypothetical protein JXB47_18325 [Anaerolineae bacterium]|nr:hypothetical protein [Anaerolineae bacterium]
MRSEPNRPPRFWPLIAIVAGVVLLLANFRLIDFDVLQLWPLLVVAVGLQALLQGDIGISWQGQTFGITRGSVEQATLEADAGEIDLRLRALRKEGRLLAGQYTARSRPTLEVEHNHATLRMRRGSTWLLSLADWDVGLAPDLPWSLLLSAHLGKIGADLRQLDIDEARISTGFGDIRLVCPDREAGPLWVRSTFGNIAVEIPEAMPAAVRIHSTALARVKVSERFQEMEPGLWLTLTPDYHGAALEPLSVEIVAVLGNVDIK